MMAITALTAYTDPASYLFSVMVIVAIFGAVNLPAVSAWCAMGTAMRRFLSDPRKLRVFNVTMALLLVASLWPLLK
jgi:threonine/homoserine/homoserine lactone efflux protein